MSCIWVVSQICCYSIWVVIIMLSVHWTITLCSENAEMYIVKRCKVPFYALNWTFILLMISLWFISMLLMDYSPICLLIVMPISEAFIWLMLALLIAKNWTIFYEYKYTNFILDSKWQQLINANKISNDINNNWFITNHNKYGNIYYVYKKCFILAMIGWLLCAILTDLCLFSNWNLYVFGITLSLYLIVATPPIIIYIIIIRKTPFFDDVYGIHWESKLHAKLLCLCMLFLVITNIFYVCTQNFAVYLFGTFGMSWSFFSMLYVSVVLLRKKQIKLKQTQSRNSLIVGDKKDYANITVDDMLANDKCVHLFMIHLSEEYSMELLLSYIEFMQFQTYLLQKNNDEDVLKQVDIVTFPSNIPLSDIIESNEDNQDISNSDDNDYSDPFLYVAKIKAHKLYTKYIQTGSEFEINICSEERSKLTTLLDDLDVLLSYNINWTDVFLLFESCKREMLWLLAASLERFKQSNQFTNIVTLCKQSKSKQENEEIYIDVMNASSLPT